MIFNDMFKDAVHYGGAAIHKRMPEIKAKDILLWRRSFVAKTTLKPRAEPRRKNRQVPIWEKAALTLDEAAEYSGIGIHKLRELTDRKNCSFVLWNGNRRLIKRKQLDEFIEESYSI